MDEVGNLGPEKILMFFGNFLTGSETLDMIAPGWIRLAGALGLVLMRLQNPQFRFREDFFSRLPIEALLHPVQYESNGQNA